MGIVAKQVASLVVADSIHVLQVIYPPFKLLRSLVKGDMAI